MRAYIRASSSKGQNSISSTPSRNWRLKQILQFTKPDQETKTETKVLQWVLYPGCLLASREGEFLVFSLLFRTDNALQMQKVDAKIEI